MIKSRVVIIASDNLLLESLLEYWAESSLNTVDLQLVSASRDSGETVLYKGRPLLFQAIDTFDFEGVKLVVVLESALVVEAYSELLQSLACPVLGYLDSLAAVKPILFDIKTVSEKGVFGLVQPPVAVLQEVLAHLTCESIDLTILYPASYYGRQGVSELASQTVRLLNAQSVEHKIFDKQMPFNYFPMADSVLGAHLEVQLVSEMKQVFVDADVHLSAVQMPVFHGIGMLVAVELSEEVELEQITSAWVESESILFENSAKNLSNMNSIQHENQILLGNVRKSQSDEYRFDCWIGVDDVKFSASNQLIFAADFLLKHDL